MDRRIYWSDFDSNAAEWVVRDLFTGKAIYRSRDLNDVEVWGKTHAQTFGKTFFLIGFNHELLAIYDDGERIR